MSRWLVNGSIIGEWVDDWWMGRYLPTRALARPLAPYLPITPTDWPICAISEWDRTSAFSPFWISCDIILVGQRGDKSNSYTLSCPFAHQFHHALSESRIGSQGSWVKYKLSPDTIECPLSRMRGGNIAKYYSHSSLAKSSSILWSMT